MFLVIIKMGHHILLTSSNDGSSQDLSSPRADHVPTLYLQKQRDGLDNEDEEAADPDMALAMGFAGFGSTK